MPEFSFNTPLKMGNYLLSILLASQCRAARAMLGYSQKDLAKRSEVGSRTLADFETGTRTPHPRTLKAIREALEDAGVIFLPAEPTLGPGIRLKQADTPSLNLIPLEEALNLFMNEP